MDVCICGALYLLIVLVARFLVLVASFFISGKFFSSTENLYYDMYVYSIMKSGH